MKGHAAATVALCGCPNVGKSTIFNALTGMKQHTGNWTGKTVEAACGYFDCMGAICGLVDLPGCCSLAAASPEEEAARSFIMSGRADCTVVVCDAGCPERGLFIALQVLKLTRSAVLCLNFYEEASKRGIAIDPLALAEQLGIEVVTIGKPTKAELSGLTAAIGRTLERKACAACRDGCMNCNTACCGRRSYCENAVSRSSDFLLKRELDISNLQTGEFEGFSAENGFNAEELWKEAESIAESVATRGEDRVSARRLKLDKLLTGRVTGRLAALLLISAVLYLTAVGSDLPSRILTEALARLLELIRGGMTAAGLPEALTDAVCGGMLGTVFTVIGVMLPPMAIFFPLFALLEDIGLLPRIAFNMDRAFFRCGSCGRQALTMCMGLGCNAVGVTGCKIIGQRRERLLAILTNPLMPCNGRFPALIALSALLGARLFGDMNAGLASAPIMLLLILLAAGVSMLATKLLSLIIKGGVDSPFVLELPPYRRPRMGQIMKSALIDRTGRMLARAAVVSAPAGLAAWFLTRYGLLIKLFALLEPLGAVMGLDGRILTAFLLGLPANELILPLAISFGSGTEGMGSVTLICMLILMLFHSPCATTLLTVRRETRSLKWTAAALLLPNVIGVLLCIAVKLLSVI